MKENITKNFWYLTGIALMFVLIDLLGFVGVESAYLTLDKEVDSAGVAILFLFPVYMIKGIAIVFIDIFVCQFTFISCIAIVLSALIARFLFSPENGHFIGYGIFMGIGYVLAIITAILWALIIACFVFLVGLVTAIICIICFIKFCKSGWKLTVNIITANKLSHFTELAYNCDSPAILCDKDMIIHTSNSYADRLYKSYDSPEIMGRCFCSFLSDEEAQKLRSCAENLSENSSFDRLIVTYTEDNTPDLTVTAVRLKNRRLVGFLIKHE